MVHVSGSSWRSWGGVPHLERVRLKSIAAGARAGFPFTVPVVAGLTEVSVDAPVTCFVGENGSGKSTLLEGIALAAGLPTVGSDDAARDPWLESQRKLARALTLVWRQRTRRGFFLRAEDFFGFQRRLARERAELESRLEEVDRDYQDRSDLARGLARGPAAASLADMDRRYGADPDARSHGEAFLELFKARFVPGSLILLDEPEAALSPQNQLGLVAMILAMVEEGAQFVIATHSPIVLAVPGARLLSFDGGKVEETRYDALGHVQLTRDFLNDPERFLRRLR
ncbi:MAG: AAA family ATPase [Gemmatimonadales bacterium]|nr:AAA family ATPase [Gemmatimonadales bacterium]